MHWVMPRSTNVRDRDDHLRMGGPGFCCLVHGSCAGALSWPILAEHNGHDDEAEGQPRELHVDVLITLHLGLSVELVIDACQGHSAAIGSAECAIEKTGQ